MNEGNGIVTTMPVTPTYGGYGNGGFGGFGGDGWWIILLLLFAGGGWGNGFGGFGGGDLYPWMNQADITTSGFQTAATNSAIASLQNSVTSGFGDIQTALCSGFAGVEAGANARQMADMQQNFALSQQLSQCCCDNKSAIKDVQYTIATEGCQTRATSTANTQAILDKLCQLELDGVKAQVDAKNDRIAELQSQLNMATLRESQTAQNAFISQGFANEVDQLYNRLSNCPVPSTPVYGRTPIFTCNNNCGCDCGM